MPATTAILILSAIPLQGQGALKNEKSLELLHLLSEDCSQRNALCHRTVLHSRSIIIFAILDRNEDYPLSLLFEKHFFQFKIVGGFSSD